MKKIALLILISTISLSVFCQVDSIANSTKLLSTSEKDLITNQDLPDRMPRFPACENFDLIDIEKEKCGRQKLLEFIYAELKYPPKAKKRKKKGNVVVGFTVTEKGEIEDIKLLRDIGKGCGEEALRVVKKMSQLQRKWIPGIQYGKEVSVRFNLPIKFSSETITN